MAQTLGPQTFVPLPMGARSGPDTSIGLSGILGMIGNTFGGGNSRPGPAAPGTFGMNTSTGHAVFGVPSNATHIYTDATGAVTGYSTPYGDVQTPYGNSIQRSSNTSMPASKTASSNGGSTNNGGDNTNGGGSTTSNNGSNGGGGGGTQSSLQADMTKNIRDSLDATRKSIYGTIGTAGSNFGSSIQDYMTQMGQQERGINEARVQDELAREQGRLGILDMVGHGIDSGGVMLDNANASNSSAADAIARAYGVQGREQLAGVNEQFAQGEHAQDVQQQNLDEQTANFVRDAKNSKQGTVNDIVTNALQSLGELNREASYYGINAPVDLEAERQDIINRTMGALAQYDSLLSSVKTNPATAEANRGEAAKLLAAGTAPENAYTYSTIAPSGMSGPTPASIPLFTMGR